ncbi:MAG: (2Fe-2S)-binding protein [Acidimicrobiia bacterium]
MTPVGVRVSINGTARRFFCEPRDTLADALRIHCGLRGVHLGCEHGICGACTIELDGHTVRSCLMFAVQADGCEIRTVEGLSDGAELHPLQQAFSEFHALQCGFCTPGMLMTSLELLRDVAEPTEEIVRERLSGNICRCTGYQNIVDAVLTVARRSPR